MIGHKFEICLVAFALSNVTLIGYFLFVLCICQLVLLFPYVATGVESATQVARFVAVNCNGILAFGWRQQAVPQSIYSQLHNF